MNKEQAIHSFWSGFGIPAYDENTVPKDAELPYITYDVAVGSIGTPVMLHASIWYRSTSWAAITLKAHEIAEAIGYGFITLPTDDGYIYVTKGTPFAQRMSDPVDENIRRIYINLSVEYLAAY